MNKFKERAKENFFKREYKSALLNYALSLKEFPNDEEAKLGAVLCDLALEREEEAVALFEYYELSKTQEGIDSKEIVEEIIESVDNSISKISSFFMDYLNEKLMMEEGIDYRDFMAIVEERGDFKSVFEDIMFSTRVLISRKEDFIDFLKQLLSHGFEDMALNYMEDALKIFPNDKEVRKLFDLIEKKS
ncbi:MAG: tetratricopeptide repeat protein [Epsilonproteobacteria bacterium]|nr:tetratricopeptide repeat protein [Campylobacterota bacterium]